MHFLSENRRTVRRFTAVPGGGAENRAMRADNSFGVPGAAARAALLIALAPLSAGAMEFADGHEVTFGLEAGYVHVDGYPAWTEGGFGKLRHDEDGLSFNRAFADYRGRLTDTLDTHVVLEAYDDGVGSAIDYTEAYVEWRPVPRSSTRYRVKLGTFYPTLSLENTGAGWSSPYTLSSSAINTWIAEEIRTTGLDLSLSFRPESLGGAQTFSFNVTAFGGNDPAGSLLSWKGWSVHDRQTRPSDDLPLPAVPQLQPGGMFGHQESWAEPLLELDREVGFFMNLEWQLGSRVLVRLSRYDNEADPEVFKRGQYAWLTKFDHVAVQATLPGDVGLFAQWMGGSTVMGPWLGEWYPVDAEYEAAYLMLTRSLGRHRVSARYDSFSVRDYDEIPGDDNGEDGHAWTLAYQYRLNGHATLALEWLRIRSERPAFAYFDLPETATEEQLQAVLRLGF